MRVKNANSLTRSRLHEILVGAIEYVFDVADPYKAVVNYLTIDDNKLKVGNDLFSLEGKVHVVGFGKAVRRMGEAVNDVVGDYVSGGILITPDTEGYIGPIKLLRGDHPLPSYNTLRSSSQLLDYLNSINEKDIVLVLVSGGGSSLFEVPEDGISVNDIARISMELMRRGANIYELNCVRKYLSRVKGGKLLKYINSKSTISLIVSDVIGDQIEIVASGPTVPSQVSLREVKNILQKYGLSGELSNVKKLLNETHPKVQESPFELEELQPSKVFNYVILSNAKVLKLLAEYFESLGFKAVILTSMLEGEAREAGRFLASVIKSVHAYGVPVNKPAAIIAGGETVVTVKGSGVGGRNQELCLSLATYINSLPNTVAACLATDGVDGVSPVAGAIVDSETLKLATRKGLNPIRYLEENDSFSFFSQLGQSIITGTTGTNVNDIFMSIIA
ncbi:MAG: glycerate kinase [Desulfurococcaceae archaeon]